MAPVTPSRQRSAVAAEPGREQAVRLNRVYNLGVHLPYGPLTPAAKEKRAREDASFGRHDRIVNLLRFHHFQNRALLPALLDDFDAQAREQCNTVWIRKPRLRAAGPPRAIAPEDQAMLQELLLNILTEAKNSLAGSSQTTQTRTQTADTAATTETASTPNDEIDNVPVMTIPGQWVTARGRAASISTESDSSISTAMFSARDSFEEGGDTQLSEFADTEDGNGLERTVSHFSAAGSDVSDSSLDALNETLDLYEQGLIGDESVVSDSRPDVSGLPDMNSLNISDSEVPGLWERLESVFPPAPKWLRNAPFHVVWEVTRISLFCGVNLSDISLKYSPLWQSQAVLRHALSGHASFAGKSLPEPASQFAWEAVSDGEASRRRTNKLAVFTISMDYNFRAGPLYWLRMNPISLDLSHRLARRFGSDRFIEIVFPSHNFDHSVPKILRKDEKAAQEVNRWLTQQRHDFLGRRWAAFFIKDAGQKKASSGQPPGATLLKKVYLFSEDGFGLSTRTGRRQFSQGTGWFPGAALQVHEMLDWLLQYSVFNENRAQPFLKLFSRISLGLSRTIPTIIFKPYELRHYDQDILSPTGRVMNDGIGRMSLGVARKLRTALRLSDLPSVVQGRLGCAKGMWVLDPQDNGQEDWIETYPSQRKWKCDFEDEVYRTLEVCNYAAEVRSAGLNKQLLSILEDRALDQTRLWDVIGNIMGGTIHRDLASYKAALEDPLLFSAWVQENSSSQGDRTTYGQVRFLGGLPDKDEDVMQFLLHGGFDPRAQKMLWERAYNMQLAKCEKLRDKVNVRVGRTAYLPMVVDFLGVLEEGEVQVCFSSKFQAEADGEPNEDGDDGSFSGTDVAGMDVLVARSPAHYTSDIQKVRAVLREELRVLKDVIVFSSKGDGPLADKLSGGDYDGDTAWVCWDPRIVDNFESAEEPEKPDLLQLGYVRKMRTTMDELADEMVEADVDVSEASVMGGMIERSFRFHMQKSMLGLMTVYKEELCYCRGTIGDETAVTLSTLLGDLVDQAKQGTEFDEADFKRLRTERLVGPNGRRPAPEKPGKPLYKRSDWPQGRAVTSLIDHLKFAVATPLVKAEINALDELGRLANEGVGSLSWDADLAGPAKAFEALAQRSAVCRAILDGLEADIKEVERAWDKSVGRWKVQSQSKEAAEDVGYRQRVLEVYGQWRAISVRLPEGTGRGRRGPTAEDEAIAAVLQATYGADEDHSPWALLRASQMYRSHHRRSHFVWRIAGRQLQAIKAHMLHGDSDGLGSGNVMVTPGHYAASRADGRTIRNMVKGYEQLSEGE